MLLGPNRFKSKRAIAYVSYVLLFTDSYKGVKRLKIALDVIIRVRNYMMYLDGNSVTHSGLRDVAHLTSGNPQLDLISVASALDTLGPVMHGITLRYVEQGTSKLFARSVIDNPTCNQLHTRIPSAYTAHHISSDLDDRVS